MARRARGDGGGERERVAAAAWWTVIREERKGARVFVRRLGSRDLSRSFLFI